MFKLHVVFINIIFINIIFINLIFINIIIINIIIINIIIINILFILMQTQTQTLRRPGSVWSSETVGPQAAFC